MAPGHAPNATRRRRSGPAPGGLPDSIGPAPAGPLLQSPPGTRRGAIGQRSEREPAPFGDLTGAALGTGGCDPAEDPYGVPLVLGRGRVGADQLQVPYDKAQLLAELSSGASLGLLATVYATTGQVPARPVAMADQQDKAIATMDEDPGSSCRRSPEAPPPAAQSVSDRPARGHAGRLAAVLVGQPARSHAGIQIGVLTCPDAPPCHPEDGRPSWSACREQQVGSDPEHLRHRLECPGGLEHDLPVQRVRHPRIEVAEPCSRSLDAGEGQRDQAGGSRRWQLTIYLVRRNSSSPFASRSRPSSLPSP